MVKQNLEIITLQNNRPSLKDDFNIWLKNRPTTAYSLYDDMSWWDYGDDDEDYDLYGSCFDWGLDLTRRNHNTDYDDEDDDEFDWYSERKKITDWQEAYDKALDDEEAYENYWKKKSKSRKHKKSKDDDYSLSDKELDDIIYKPKTIYYYSDINQENNKRIFHNLYQFYNFLEEQGIDISDSEGAKFIREDIRHCCIDPIKRADLHTNEIISDHSYGALAYEVSSGLNSYLT